MVVNLYSIYIALYPIIYLKALCENCSFFHYFPKIPKQIKKKHNFKIFLKIFFCVFWLIYADILVSKQILIVPKRNKSVDATR